ncbi:TPA: O125 family O-antigen flippase, partial [Escherichia coli]|nr:O125 family O-antigen flippase [Escherichia coli]
FIKNYIWINIISSLISAIYAFILTISFGMRGALIAVVSNQAILFFVTFFYSKKYLREYYVNNCNRIDISILKRIIIFSLMTVTSAILVPVSTLYVRNEIITSINIEYAGLWDAVNRISSVYLMLITTTLGVYFFPRFSSASNRSELLNEIKVCYLYLVPLVCISSVLMYTFRGLIVNILFTHEFVPIVDVIVYQLIGDFFKIIAWVLGYLLISKAFVKEYIVLEVLQWSVYCILSKYSLCYVENAQISYVFKAYIISQALYMFSLIVTICYLLNKNKV